MIPMNTPIPMISSMPGKMNEEITSRTNLAWGFLIPIVLEKILAVFFFQLKIRFDFRGSD